MFEYDFRRLHGMDFIRDYHKFLNHVKNPKPLPPICAVISHLLLSFFYSPQLLGTKFTLSSCHSQTVLRKSRKGWLKSILTKFSTMTSHLNNIYDKDIVSSYPCKQVIQMSMGSSIVVFPRFINSIYPCTPNIYQFLCFLKK